MGEAGGEKTPLLIDPIVGETKGSLRNGFVPLGAEST